MNIKRYTIRGKGMIRTFEIRWTDSRTSFFVGPLDKSVIGIPPHPIVGIPLATIHHLDELRTHVPDLGTLPDSEFEELRKACADCPLPARLFWRV